jgi:hypothetical protein
MIVIAGSTLGWVVNVTRGKYEILIDNKHDVFHSCGSDMENSLLDSVLCLV